jgi:putative peptidoglycan lipid II flippase
MSRGGQQIAKAAVVVMALFALSRLLGIVRQAVVAALFGTGSELDAFVVANQIPEAVFLIVAGGALGSAFIPVFADRLARGERAGAWRLASAVANLAVIATTVVAGLTALFAPALVQQVLAPGFDPQQQALTTGLLRVMLISPIVFGVSGIVMGALNAQQHFLMPALAASIYNVSIIGGALLGQYLGTGVQGIAIGVVAGSVLHLLIQVPALLRHGARYTPALGLNDPGVREVGRLMAPRVLGTAIVQVNFLVNNSLASGMFTGAASAINYAWRLMLLPQGILAQAVGTAAFPTFAEQAAQGEYEKMRSTLAATLRAVLFLSLPATVGLLALGRPLVGILFERGAFDESSTTEVVWALAFFTLGLVGHAGLEVVARAFYALHDTFTPVWVGSLAVALNVALSLTLPGVFEAQGWMKHGGLALANSVATLLEMAALLALIRRRMHGLEGHQMLVAVAKSGSAALAMGAALLGWRALLPDAPLLLTSGGGVVLGVVVYLSVALLLRAEELQAVVRMVRNRRRAQTNHGG